MKKKLKWIFYEKRYQFREFYFHKIIRRHICEKYLNIDPIIPFYANKWVMSNKKTNKWIADKIMEGKPFMVARFGNTELSVMTSVLKRRLFGWNEENEKRFCEWFGNLGELSGFFPMNPQLAETFTDLMLDSCKEVDMQAMYHCYLDDYIVTEYMNDTKVTYLNNIEPWRSKVPWSLALKGKKVLVIHPFDDSIRRQYQRREKLFLDTNILPEFELRTLKAVQTIAGEKDDRFDSWFDALNYMYEEAMRMDFDIAIIGCGAYGFPLAAKLKKSGKQVIHMGGVTQILFGIKGRRWVDNPRCGIQFNENWIYPREEETPKNATKVENHCYW